MRTEQGKPDPVRILMFYPEIERPGLCHEAVTGSGRTRLTSQ